MIRKRRNGLQVQVYAGRDPHRPQTMGQPPGPWTDQAVLPGSQEDRGGAPGAGGPWPTPRSSSRTVAELIERWLGWRQQVRPISPVTVANYRGAIDRYILPNLGRAKVQQVDASTIDALYEHVRVAASAGIAGSGFGGQPAVAGW